MTTAWMGDDVLDREAASGPSVHAKQRPDGWA